MSYYKLKQGENLILAGAVTRRPYGSEEPFVAVDLSAMDVIVTMSRGSRLQHEFGVIKESNQFATEILNTKGLFGAYDIEVGLKMGDGLVIASSNIDIEIDKSLLGELNSVVAESDIVPTVPTSGSDAGDWEYKIEVALVGDKAFFSSFPSTTPVTELLLGRVIKGEPGDISEEQMEKIIADVLKELETQGIATPQYVQEKIAEAVAALVNGAPSGMDTLKGLADAIGVNSTAISDLVGVVATKLNKTQADALYVALSGYVAYSQAEKSKLAGIQEGAQVNPATLPNPNALTINGTSYDGTKAVEMTISGGGGGAVDSVNGKTGVVTLSAEDVGAIPLSKEQTFATKTELSTKVNDSDLATVAKSGSYNDLSSKPTLAPSDAERNTIQTVKVNGVALVPDADRSVNVIASGGGGGAVDSVNGQIGAVILNAEDVGAVASNEAIVYLEDVDTLTQSMLSAENTVYVFTRDYSLNGQAINVPNGCTLEMNKSTLSNGTINFNNTTLLVENTSRLNVVTTGAVTNDVFIANALFGQYHIELIAPNIYICEDMAVDGANIQSNLIGAGGDLNHEGIVALYFTKGKNLLVKNLTINSTYVGAEGGYNKAIYMIDSPGLTIEGCRINGGSIYLSSTTADADNISIRDCVIDVDFATILQDMHTQHDVITFRGISGLVCESNIITAKDVNRVFKIASGNNAGVWDLWSENIIIRGNKIDTNSINGKQVFDLFDYTRNIDINGNTISEQGHTMVFEHKYVGDINGFLNIRNNNVKYSFELIYTAVNGEVQVSDNIFTNTSTATSKETFGGGVSETLSRGHLIDLRNIPSFIISDNVFNTEVAVIPFAYLSYSQVSSVAFKGNICESHHRFAICQTNDSDITYNVQGNTFNAITATFLIAQTASSTFGAVCNLQNNVVNTTLSTLNLVQAPETPELILDYRGLECNAPINPTINTHTNLVDKLAEERAQIASGIVATSNAYTDEKIGDIDSVLDNIIALQNTI